MGTTRTVRTIAIAGAGADAPVVDFCAELCRALGAFGKVFHLTKSRFEDLYARTTTVRILKDGGGFDDHRGVVNWLSEMEGGYRFSVYEADSSTSPWTMHCLRQADCILVVGRAGASPALSAVEKAIFGSSDSRTLAPVELVLLHDQPQRVFAGTAAWLADRQIVRHHHMRVQPFADIERLARILAGQAMGLVLGGGGARGFAHIGVIRAIEEAGIPIDMICGVSMGAIIAAQYALGNDWESMIRMNKREMGRKMGGDLTLPIMSLSSGRTFRRALNTFFGTTNIEDLWLNYFCVSCNLSTNESVVHRRGRLTKCVNASNAIPGVLPPVLEEGEILVDGGILNNQPGDLLKQAGGGQVIVCNVSPNKEMTVDPSLAEMPSAWRVLWKRLSPFHKSPGVPSITALLTRTLMVASQRKSREVESLADFYLRPPVQTFGLTDSLRVEEIAEVGYQYAKQEIATWRATNRLGAPSR